MPAAELEDTFSWVTISGTEYRIGLAICSESEHEMPVLASSVVYFVVSKLVVDHFSEDFHAYQVFESDEKDVIRAVLSIISLLICNVHMGSIDLDDVNKNQTLTVKVLILVLL